MCLSQDGSKSASAILSVHGLPKKHGELWSRACASAEDRNLRECRSGWHRTDRSGRTFALAHIMGHVVADSGLLRSAVLVVALSLQLAAFGLWQGAQASTSSVRRVSDRGGFLGLLQPSQSLSHIACVGGVSG